MKIAIVGASIAGCACAIQLIRLGFNVTIYEKSKESLKSRGAGIMLPQDLVAKLINEDMVPLNFPSIKINERTVYTYENTTDEARILTTDTILGAVVNWSHLYGALESNINRLISYNNEVTYLNNGQECVELELNKSIKVKFDYVIFADGINSIGRSILYEKLKPDYANYIAWRGLAKISKHDAKKFLGKAYDEQLQWYLYERGHLLLYAIPDIDDPNNQQLINWVVYENITDIHELFGNNKEAAKRNIVRGEMPPSYKEYLHKIADRYFPKFPRELIKSTVLPFAQAIYDLQIPHYLVGRVCLVGDASTILRPHSASGATKALQDAFALGDIIKKDKDLSTALKKWDEQRCNATTALFLLAQKLGKHFVTDVPDLKSLDKHKMDNLWHNITSQSNWYVIKK